MIDRELTPGDEPKGSAPDDAVALFALAAGVLAARGAWRQEARHVLWSSFRWVAATVLTVWCLGLLGLLDRSDPQIEYLFGLDHEAGLEMLGLIATVSVAIHILATLDSKRRDAGDPVARYRQRVHGRCLELASATTGVVALAMIIGTAPHTISLPTLIVTLGAVAVVGALAVDARLEWSQVPGGWGLEAFDRAEGAVKRQERRTRLDTLISNWSSSDTTSRRWPPSPVPLLLGSAGFMIAVAIQGGWPGPGPLLLVGLPVAVHTVVGCWAPRLIVDAANGSAATAAFSAFAYIAVVVLVAMAGAATAVQGDGETTAVLGWIVLVGAAPVAVVVRQARRGPDGRLRHGSVLADRVVERARCQVRRMEAAEEQDRACRPRVTPRAGLGTQLGWAAGWVTVPSRGVAPGTEGGQAPRWGRSVRRPGWLGRRRRRRRP